MQSLGLLELSQKVPRPICDFASWPQSAQDLALTGDLFGDLSKVPSGHLKLSLVRVIHSEASLTAIITLQRAQESAKRPPIARAHFG